MNEKKVLYPDAIIKACITSPVDGCVMHFSADFGLVKDETGNLKEWLSTDGKNKAILYGNPRIKK